MKKLLALTMLCLLSNTGVALANEGVRLTTITDGDGPTPTASDTVRVHYRGTLVDGTEFDSSARRGPATFSLSGVIPCWTAGVAQMHVGEVAQLVCPPTLAYGAQGVPGVIPPNSTLVFEIQLLDIVRR